MKRTSILCLCAVVFAMLTGSVAADTLRVLALRSEPFFFEKDGKNAGIEYEILEHFAKMKELELEVEYVASFPDLLTRVARGDADIASGTITITPERAQNVDFSAPYFPVQIVLVERSGETSGSLQDLAGFTVAAFAKTTAADALNEVSNITVVQRDGIEGMLDAVESGELRAAAADSSAVILALDDYPSLEISLTFGEPQSFGFALPKGSELKDALSQHVLGLKESGFYFRLITEYMGQRASSIVRAARAR